MLQLQQRKRFRLTVVCNVCKRRKIKCDRNSPCSSCIKSNVIDQCIYEDPFWVAANAKNSKDPATDQVPSVLSEVNELKTKIEYLEKVIKHQSQNPGSLLDASPRKPLFSNHDNSFDSEYTDYASMVGVNPSQLVDGTISFFDSKNTSLNRLPKFNSRIDVGPFSWHSLVRRDPCLFDFWGYMTNKRNTLLENTSLNGINGKPTPNQILFAIRKYLDILFKNNRPSTGLPSGIFSTHDEVQELIKLPNPDIVDQYIDVFFKNIYPFFPFLDENDFRSSVKGIYENGLLRVSDSSQYATLGQLLIVLRMSYLSLLPNDKEQKPTHSLAEHPIGVEYVDWAKLCLNQFDVLSNLELPVVQCGLFIWIYLLISPESSDGPDRNQFQVLSGMVILMAHCVGLNRDPENFAEVSGNLDINNLRRKIWGFIVYLDIQLSLAYGSPLTVNRDFYDTKEPLFIASLSKSRNPELEKDIILSSNSVSEILQLSLTFLRKVLVINAELNVLEVLDLISKMEIDMQKTFGTFADFSRSCLSENCVDLKSTNLKWLRHFPLFVTLRLFHVYMYFTMFLKYEKSNQFDLMFFYFKKTICVIAEEILPYLNDLLLKPNPATDHAASFILSSSLETAVRRIDGCLFSSIIRINHTIQSLPEAEKISENPYFASLKRLNKMLAACVKLNLISINKISHKFWYAWRIMKAHSFMLNEVLHGEYFQSMESMRRTTSLSKLYLTEDQVNECIEILERNLGKLRKRGLKSEWEVVSDVSEATKLAASAEVTEEDNSTSGNSASDSGGLDLDLDHLWTGINEQKNISKHSGSFDIQNILDKEGNEYDFGFQIELKDFQDVLDSYFELDLPILESIPENFTN